MWAKQIVCFHDAIMCYSENFFSISTAYEIQGILWCVWMFHKQLRDSGIDSEILLILWNIQELVYGRIWQEPLTL